jgi:predicted secreted protein
MNIELNLNENDIFILISAINQVITSKYEFISSEFVHEQMKDKAKNENKVLCKILTQLNHQARKIVAASIINMFDKVEVIP